MKPKFLTKLFEYFLYILLFFIVMSNIFIFIDILRLFIVEYFFQKDPESAKISNEDLTDKEKAEIIREKTFQYILENSKNPKIIEMKHKLEESIKSLHFSKLQYKKNLEKEQFLLKCIELKEEFDKMPEHIKRHLEDIENNGANKSYPRFLQIFLDFIKTKKK